ncbi:hypothetical protein RFM23_17170 [Mesorhizobium abyssinicae]|uniref:Uncharacterized protein n=1 Tax=Mesorhizobium abyssinicae TaxID=1209958 RepID=A0ABU5APW8_9HYPH|nr:hypothetical protein [Mesorhizobium abyssinicae]MDX8539353.1 hypothetical protein [Mesorhizobium abyssinicae]
MIYSLFRRTERWAPATTGEHGEPLFTPEFALELTRLHLSGLGDESGAASEATPDRLKQVLQSPELLLAYELVPEIIAEYSLRKLSAPKAFDYVLSDRHGRAYAFNVARHPVVRPVHDALARQLLPAFTVETVGKASSYAATVSSALNAGQQLENLSVCVAPIGLGLHRDKLEIK